MQIDTAEFQVLTAHVLPLEPFADIYGLWMYCDAPGCDHCRLVTVETKQAFDLKQYTCGADPDRPIKGCHRADDEGFLKIAKDFLSNF